MYESYWGLSRAPFQTATDAGSFFDSATHHEALSRMFFLVEEFRHCGTLTGPSGIGKSFLLRIASQQLQRTQRVVISIDLRGMNASRLLWNIAASLRLGPDDSDSSAELWRMVEDYLHGLQHSGLQRVFLFDHLDRAASDCSAVIEGLMHIDDGPSNKTTFLAASQSLDGQLPSSLFANRSELQIDLVALNLEETGRYVRTLMERAGSTREVFRDSSIAELFDQSGGVPRDINRLCDLSLLAAMGQRLQHVDATVVGDAANELRTTVNSDGSLPVLFESA